MHDITFYIEKFYNFFCSDTDIIMTILIYNEYDYLQI